MDFSRLRYRPDGQPIELPVHLFFVITFVYGVIFTVPLEIFAPELAPLFVFSNETHAWLDFAWGLWLIVTCVLNLVTVLTGSSFSRASAAMMGLTGWLYAGIVYIHLGFWLGFLTIAAPMIAFWVWYYFRLRAWGRYLELID